MVSDEEALLELLSGLRQCDYEFSCVTPATHERVLARRFDGEISLRDMFGWNRTFSENDLPPRWLRLLERANCIEQSGNGLRSRVRVASLGRHLFLHSSFPTDAENAVFFGPDTYRFVRFVSEQLRGSSPRWIVDMGSGAGAGGIIAARQAPSARVTLVDINPLAAQLARINAHSAGADVDIVVADEMPAGPDLIIANPPYMIDGQHRTYRDGGDLFGGEIACRWVEQALERLAPGGEALIYTGVAFLDGQSPALQKIASLCDASDAELEVDEIDPDVFGEELTKTAYRQVERIAAVGLSVHLRGGN